MQASLSEHSYSEYGAPEKVLCILCTRGGLFTAQHVSWLSLEQKKKKRRFQWRNLRKRDREWLFLPDQSCRSCPIQKFSSTAICIYSVAPRFVSRQAAQPSSPLVCIGFQLSFSPFFLYSLLSSCFLSEFRYLIIFLVFRPNQPVPLPNRSLS